VTSVVASVPNFLRSPSPQHSKSPDCNDKHPCLYEEDKEETLDIVGLEFSEIHPR
jgi:hypothetical protein